jgi:hypothetical protein
MIIATRIGPTPLIVVRDVPHAANATVVHCSDASSRSLYRSVSAASLRAISCRCRPITSTASKSSMTALILLTGVIRKAVPLRQQLQHTRMIIGANGREVLGASGGDCDRRCVVGVVFCEPPEPSTRTQDERTGDGSIRFSLAAMSCCARR